MTLSARGFVATINHLLVPAGWARERLVPHAGRCAQLRAEPVDIRFSVSPEGYLCTPAADDVPAVTLSIPLSAVPGLVGGDHDKAMNALRIEGSADFADALGFVFRNLRWDAEEDLSRVFGDIVAHRLVAGAQSFRQVQQRALNGVTENVGEYLSQEQRFLATRNTLEPHIEALQALRDDVARLEKRIERLTRPPRR
jgi:ubiquinone biosynthesis protein UbiJ